MNATEITFAKALKIWWSFSWRAMLLMIPVTVVSMAIAIWIIPFPKARQPAPAIQPDQLAEMTSKMFVLWLFMVIFAIAAQVQAIRWMLKTKWSGFRLQAVSDG